MLLRSGVVKSSNLKLGLLKEASFEVLQVLVSLINLYIKKQELRYNTSSCRSRYVEGSLYPFCPDLIFAKALCLLMKTVCFLFSFPITLASINQSRCPNNSKDCRLQGDLKIRLSQVIFV